MTTDPIESAAREILSEWDRIEGEAMYAGQVAQDPQAHIDEQQSQITEILRRHLPQWRDKPTSIGWWIGDETGRRWRIVRPEDCPNLGHWYGPIPTAPQEQR